MRLPRALWALAMTDLEKSRINFSVMMFFLIAFVPSSHAVPPKLPEPQPLNFKVPNAKRFELSNKLVVYLIEDKELPQVQMTLTFHAGAIFEPADKVGLSSLLAALLPHGGTKQLKADAITKELELMGSSISAGTGEEAFTVSLFSLTKNLGRTLELFRQVVTQPAFDNAKLEVEKKQTIEAINRRNDEPRAIVSREFRRMMYGADSPWGRRSEIKTVKAVARGDLARFQESYFKPNNAILTVSGDVEQSAIQAALEEKLGQKAWPEMPVVLPSADFKPLARSQRAVFFVAKESVAQSVVRLGVFGIRRHDPDYFALELMNEILGGGFTSRLFRNVRSRQGLAYSVGSNYTNPSVEGIVYAAVGSKSQSTVQAAQSVIKEIQMMKEAPPTEEELSVAKNQLVNSFVKNFGTTRQTVGQIANLEFYGYPKNYLDNYTKNLAAIRGEDVVRVATKYWKPQDALIVVVGNPKEFDQDLSVLGPVKVLNPETGEVQNSDGKPSQK